MARVFISYKRNAFPDEAIALQLFEALNRQHLPFMDRVIGVGTRWAERIEGELLRSEYLIALLSEQSVASEMVLAEIETAHRLAKEHSGRPVIIPIRLAYKEPLQYPLSAYLNAIQHAYWSCPEDTPHLIEELARVISGGELTAIKSSPDDDPPGVASASPLPSPFPSAQTAPLEMPEGTMSPESAFYRSRPFDAVAAEAIKHQGVTITIKGPRQMGKSSLLIRTAAEASKAGKRVAFLDFQLIDQAALANAGLFFKQFCHWLNDALETDDKVQECWSVPLGNSQLCTRYLSRYILKDLAAPLVLAMDEVDSLFESDFRSDFFGMLRTWHNSRAVSPTWKQLDMILVTSTEPYQLIENLNQSPFNVGEVIELTDFNLADVADLNARHDSPLTGAEIRKLLALVGGHPYLIRRALYLIAGKQLTVEALFATATDDRGPFGDHLRYHLFRLHKRVELIEGMRQVIRNHACRDDLIYFRLRGAGLVRREGHKVLPRSSLYADYFREHLNV